MSENILDISKWTPNYPFKNTVWDTYNDFNKPVKGDENESNYDFLCDQIVRLSKGDLLKHKNVCMKLMRNLGHHSVNSKDYEITTDRCNILFNWLYNFLEEDKITYDIIDKCFETYDDYRLRKGNIKKKCLYFKDQKFKEPTKITLLDIFNDNTSIIKNTLKNEDVSISNRARKYVCECVNIYQHMNKTYCPNGKEIKEDYKSTCLKLNHFEISYNLFLTTLGGLYTNIPSLDDKGNKFSVKCPPDEHDTLLTSDGLQALEPPLRKGLFSRAADRDRALTDVLPAPLGNGDSEMKKIITTTIGTFAGASSLLALLYRFTPAGRLVNPQLRRSTGIINNNFHEGANGMLFDGNKHNGFNSYNIGYEAA